jgi:hypothetical protein
MQTAHRSDLIQTEAQWTAVELEDDVELGSLGRAASPNEGGTVIVLDFVW